MDAVLNGPVLFCECAHTQNIPDERRRTMRAALAECGRTVIAVDDLCGLAAARDPRLETIAAADSATIFACYPRAVRWLLDWADRPLNLKRTQILNMRTTHVEALLAAIGATAPAIESDAAEPAPAAQHAVQPEWRPWFPVIDFERCTNCRQCVTFCLFGVYVCDAAGRVTVQNPANCKNNCPACARMCPHAAIMFPKIEEHSPISGSLLDPAQTPDKVRLSRDALFGAPNALDAIRKRGRRRPALLNNTPRQNPHGHPIDPTHARRDG